MKNYTFTKILSVFGLANIFDLTEQVRIKQVSILYEQLSSYILIAEAAAATGIVIILWNPVRHSWLIVWLIFMYIGSGLLRWMNLRFHHNNTSKYTSNTWIKLFAVGVFLSGIGWGSVGLFLMPKEGVIYQTAVIIVIFGITAVANNLFSSVLSVSTLFLFLVFTPLLGWFFLQGGPYVFIGFMSFLYIISMISSAFYINNLVITSLILSFKNLDLALNEKRLSNELIIASRYAGMADIATNILHNIGNVLTSTSTSVSLISNKITSSKMSNLVGLSQLFQEHQDELAVFMTTDPKGQRIPNYLATLSKTWGDDKKYILGEVESLNSNIQHIKEVISKQNILGRSLVITQEVDVTEIIEDALKLGQLNCEQSQITIIREFSPVKKIHIDRVKLLQILVNLIKNGIESILEANFTMKQLTLRVYDVNGAFFVIEIIDNGVGISLEHLKRIFHQGFTSKKNGHGFGLHFCSLAAQEMYGSLSAQSDGVGKGAVFTLTLPYQPSKTELQGKNMCDLK